MNIYTSAILEKLICANVEQKKALSHFLLECKEFDTAREPMRIQLFGMCGITHLDLNLLLDAKEDDK